MLHPDLWFLPKVKLSERDRLPEEPGIYYACDRSGTVRYVGMSKNLYRRWNSKGEYRHHKLNELLNLRGVDLRYRLVPEHRLEYEEAIEIHRFQPDLNRLFPDPEDHQTVRIAIEDFLNNLGQVAGWAIVAFLILQMSGVPLAQTFLNVVTERIEEARR